MVVIEKEQFGEPNSSPDTRLNPNIPLYILCEFYIFFKWKYSGYIQSDYKNIPEKCGVDAT